MTECEKLMAQWMHLIPIAIKGNPRWRRCISRFGSDMEADGLLGLWKAARTWNGKDDFKKWAAAKINFAIADGFRQMQQTRRRGRLTIVEMPDHVEFNGREAAASVVAQVADTVAMVKRRCGRDWPAIESLMNGGTLADVCGVMGMTPSNVSRRRAELAEELRGQRDLIEELTCHQSKII